AWRRRKRVPLDLLCEQPLILREAGSGSRWCLEQALGRAGKSLGDLHVALELGSNEAIKEAVLRGLGLAVLSTHAAHKEIEAGQPRALEGAGLALPRGWCGVGAGRRPPPPPPRLFLDLLEPCPGAARDS